MLPLSATSKEPALRKLPEPHGSPTSYCPGQTEPRFARCRKASWQLHEWGGGLHTAICSGGQGRFGSTQGSIRDAPIPLPTSPRPARLQPPPCSPQNDSTHGGLSHLRCRNLTPVPQVLLHMLHRLHTLQSPSTCSGMGVLLTHSPVRHHWNRRRWGEEDARCPGAAERDARGTRRGQRRGSGAAQPEALAEQTVLRRKKHRPARRSRARRRFHL